MMTNLKRKRESNVEFVSKRQKKCPAFCPIRFTSQKSGISLKSHIPSKAESAISPPITPKAPLEVMVGSQHFEMNLQLHKMDEQSEAINELISRHLEQDENSRCLNLNYLSEMKNLNEFKSRAEGELKQLKDQLYACLLYTSPSPRDS